MNGRTLLLGTWGVLVAGAAVTLATLQALGPPSPPAARTAMTRPLPGLLPPPPSPKPAPGTIAAPDPSLMVRMPDQPDRMLPMIGADGRTPSVVYAASPPGVLPNQARLALVVDGIGLDGATSAAAIAQLPAPVSLAFSPYGTHLDRLAAAARARGHEFLVSIPMEPEGSPDNDEGNRQLSPGNDDATNERNLTWVLSSLQGYVGATGAESGQSGEHVLDDPSALATLTQTLASRGLIYVDPRPGASLPAGTQSIAATTMVDGTSELVDLQAQLGALVATAQRDGQALGIVGPLRESSLARLMAWVRTLPGLGIILVPASSLTRMSARVTTIGPAGVTQ